MKFFFALFFVAAVAQAIDVDWESLDTMNVFPEDIAQLLAEPIENALDVFPEDIAVEDPASRIVGGQEAAAGQFPYQVGLFISTAPGVGFCGGSILNENWILTAAHCADGALSAEVVVGAQKIRDNEPSQIRIQAKRFVVHEKYNPSIIKNDIALIELAKPIKLSARVQPVRLPTRAQASNTFAGVTGTVSGWGKDSDSATAISPVLRWTQNPITTLAVCKKYYVGNVDSDQICLAGTGGRSSCNGDSGGPLVVADHDGKPTQVGIVSFGIAVGCARGWPGVFVRVSSYLDWIKTHTNGAIVIH